MKRFFTYIHKNNNDEVFYVGCASTHPNNRGFVGKHKRAYAKDGHSSLWEEGAKNGYYVEIIEYFEDRDAAFLAERHLIEKLRNDGCDLTNICDGGKGAPGLKDSIETRRRKAESKFGDKNPMFGKIGSDHPNSRKVIDRSTGVIYDSVQIASERLGFKMKTLYNWLSGHRRNPTSLEFA